MRIITVSPIPGLVAGAGLEQMVVTVLVLFLIEAADCWGWA